MTDKEMLEEVYRKLCFVTGNWKHMNMDRLFDGVHNMKDLIERHRGNGDDWKQEEAGIDY